MIVANKRVHNVITCVRSQEAIKVARLKETEIYPRSRNIPIHAIIRDLSMLFLETGE